MGSGAKKTKRLHWFNFGLHFGLESLHEGLQGTHYRFALVCMAGKDGRIWEGSRLRAVFCGLAINYFIQKVAYSGYLCIFAENLGL